MGASRLEVRDLLEHAGYLRRLAAGLLRGADADPEDIVQEAYVVALVRPPDPDRPARPWLAQVVRNLSLLHRRGEGRRRWRETEWDGGRDIPAPDALLERAAAHRALADQVLALDEPFRRTVLLRYVEGLSSSRIAELDGVAPGTVRWRLKEGLDRLRAGMDRATGDRARWHRALGPAAPAAAMPGTGTHGRPGDMACSASASSPSASTPSASASAASASAASASAVSAPSASTSSAPLGTTLAKGFAVAAIAAMTAAALWSATSGLGDGGLRPAGLDRRAARLASVHPAARTPSPALGSAADASPARPGAAWIEPDPAARFGLLEGMLIDAIDGRPIDGAEIVIALADGSATTLTTERAGQFRFEPEDSRPAAIAAITAPGYLPFAPAWGQSPVELHPRPGLRVRGVVVQLNPAIELIGRVVDPAGAPVAGAEIRVVESPGGEQELVSLPDRFVSDQRGEFAFRAPHGALLEARASGRLGRARVGDRAEASRRLTVALSTAPTGIARLTGVAVDPSGRPIAGIRIEAEPERARARGGPDDWQVRAPAEATTDDDGRFALTNLDPGAYRVEASGDDRAPAAARIDLTARRAADVRLVLDTGAVLSGRVRDAAGEPVPAFTLVAAQTRGFATERAVVRAVVSGDGAFSIRGLAPGRYRLWITAHGQAPSGAIDAQAVVPPAPPSPVTIRLTAGGSVRGRVLSATGQPIANARVALDRDVPSPSPFAVAPPVWTDERGVFLLPHVAAGSVSVAAEAPGYHTAVLAGIEVTDGRASRPIDAVLTPVRAGEDASYEITGIGISVSRAEDALVIEQTAPGGGAERAGLAAGDEIVEVDGVPLIQLGLDAAADAIRGPEGSVVQLGIRRPGHAAVQHIAVTRRKLRA